MNYSRFLITGFAIFLISCSQQSSQPELTPFTDMDAQIVSQNVSELLRPDERVLYVCGESNGLAVHGFEWDKGWQPDGIRGGFLAVTQTGDGVEDIIWGGDLNGVIRTTEDGGLVARTRSIDGGSHDTWIVAYPSSGITETLGIVSSPEAEFVLFHSTMKPNGPSARMFQARCKKWN